MLVSEIYGLIIPFIKSKKKRKHLKKVMTNEYNKQMHCYICKDKIAVYKAANERGIICHKCYYKEGGIVDGYKIRSII
jgi:hypothetical protein